MALTSVLLKEHFLAHLKLFLFKQTVFLLLQTQLELRLLLQPSEELSYQVEASQLGGRL